MVDNKTIRAAFIGAASTYSRLRHGRWIPLTYWVIKVNKKLPNDQRILPWKLLSSLEKLNAINRPFNSDDPDDAVYEKIKMIATQQRGVFVAW